MKRAFLVISLVLILAVGVPTGIWVWESVRPERAGAARADLQGAMSPFARSTAWVARKMSGALEYIVTAGHVRRENKALKLENGRLRIENNALREALKRYERLDAAAQLAEVRGWSVVEADVIAYGPSRWPHGIVVNRGAQDGVDAGDPVMHLSGLVGVVLQTTDRTADIQTLTDPQAAVGVVVLPSRARGVVRGRGRSDRLEIVLEDPDMPLRPGQIVATSGMKGSLYPRGLEVGVVGNLRTNRFGQTVADVEPSTVFSRIEEVLILVHAAPVASRPAAPDAQPSRGRAPAIGDDARPTTTTTGGGQ